MKRCIGVALVHPTAIAARPPVSSSSVILSIFACTRSRGDDGGEAVRMSLSMATSSSRIEYTHPLLSRRCNKAEVCVNSLCQPYAKPRGMAHMRASERIVTFLAPEEVHEASTMGAYGSAFGKEPFAARTSSD